MKQSRKLAMLLGPVVAGTAMIVATALAAGSPALAAGSPGPPRLVTHLPALRLGPRLTVLPPGARNALAPATKSRQLFGVFCTNASNCWAVGDVMGKNTTVNQVLHWTGKQWFTVKVPNQAGTAKGAINQLFAVRCTSVKDCWAVGDSQQPGSSGQLDQALHFNGKQWKVVDMPAPGGTAAGNTNDLVDVACTSAKSCWAVGEYGMVATMTEPIVLFNQAVHWDGNKWTFTKTPNPGGVSKGDGNFLDSVRCTSPAACWAAGTGGSLTKFNLRNEMFFFNGKKWTAQTVPNPVGPGKDHIDILNTLACTAPDDCWAVGEAGNLAAKPKGFEHNEALRWNGKKWAVVKTPNPNNEVDELFGVTCVAAQDCWAVGSAGVHPGVNEAFHWNGVTWTPVHAVNGGGTGTDTVNSLESVRCTSHSSCWAVGDAVTSNTVQIQPIGGTSVNQILHWNGVKWQDS